MSPDRPEQPIEIVSPTGAEPTSDSGWWSPAIGPELQAVVEKENLTSKGRERVKEEALSILSRCCPPSLETGSKTGLVIGYIQSGKTLSFTAVSALAHDNGFPLILVIAGSSTNLLKQSTDRLRQDLSAENWYGRWAIFRSDEPEITNTDVVRIQTLLDRWNDPNADEEDKKTVLITVMKDRYHLKRVIRLLEGLELRGVPTLVIDDEADQASLNIAVRDEDESATYRRLLKIRELLSNHSFLQYTATPQALLLINLIDQLSPDFAEVLTPGEAYTGGEEFFGDDQSLIEVIPERDIQRDELEDEEPPETLLVALRFFWLGVAIGLVRRRRDNRSMMIHPAYRVIPHAQHVRWVERVKDQWLSILNQSPSSPDFEDLRQDLHEVYRDLETTTRKLPPFDMILQKLRRAIGDTQVVEVNARQGETPTVRWPKYYSWILVGGQALDRGFTVEGLTVTYMPRGLGGGNADTIQQRARWFGYKEEYLGLCRVFLPARSVDAYEAYVEHEKDVRSRIMDHVRDGRALQEWKRAFILSGMLRPTRRSVIGQDFTRGLFRDSWVTTRVPHANLQLARQNADRIREFVDSAGRWTSWSDDKRLTEAHRHLVADVSLVEVRDLLMDLVFADPLDSANFNGLLVQVASYLDSEQSEPESVARVYRMRPERTTERSTNESGRIRQLLGGAWPVRSEEKIYPGDRDVRDAQRLSVQLHELTVYEASVTRGEKIAKGVPALAIWVPATLAKPWLVQEQT